LLLNTLLNIAIFQGVILGIIILKSPLFKSKANTYLALMIFSLSIAILNLVLERVDAYATMPYLLFLDNIEFAFVIPVFLLLYIMKLIDLPITRSKQNIWLFTPFIYSATINIINDLDEVAHVYKATPEFRFVIETIQIIEFPLIVLFIPYVLIQSSRWIKHANNAQEKKWLTYLWLSICALFSSWILVVISGMFFDLTKVMLVLALFAVFLIHWTAYFGIYKFRLARDQEGIKALISKRNLIKLESEMEEDIESKQPEVLPEAKPEVKSEVKPEVLTKEHPHFKRLEALCVNQHIYRDSTLDRTKIAEELGISPGYVSQLVNTVTGKNFASYINHYRVEAVKEMILDSEFDNYSLLAIGLECGFSSKTTFHNSFKKVTGITPNAFRKLNK